MALGIILGVIGGRPEKRRLAGVGKADTRRALNRLCGAGPDERLTGVLWTGTLPTDVHDCGRCARENFGVAPSGESPIQNLGILN